MRTHLYRALVCTALSFFALWLTIGCGKQNPDILRENAPPDTEVRLEADRADTVGLKVHLLWSGTDADGHIACYETRWDTSPWERVAVSDSVYRLAPAGCADSVALARIYTFSVRAVDDDGARDPTPATVTFTARNTLPETEITSGPEGVTGPMVFFEWRGWDYDGVVAGYSHRLYRWDEGSSDWDEIAAADGLGPDEVSAFFGPMAGLHKFAVWSIDDVGGADPTPAERTFTCNPALAGATLYVRTNVFTVQVFRGPTWSASHDVPIPIFEGEHLTFDWTATAEDYGGQVVGYRHAYDDTSTWPPWSLNDTSFQVTPGLGEHSLYVSALDNANIMTRARICFDVVEATLDEYVLIVDDYDFRETLPPWATDVQRDAFYDTLTMGCARPRLQWDVTENIVSGLPQPPDVETLAGASTVIWYLDSEVTALPRLFDPFSTTYVTLAGYLRAGGNLVLCGWEVLSQITGETYPIAISASDTAAGPAFVRDHLRVGYADNSGYAANKEAPWDYGYCFYGAVPGGTGVPEGRDIQLAAMYIDSLGKWSGIYDNPNPNYNKAGLPGVEKLEAYDYEGAPIETHFIDAYLNMNYEGEPCIVLSVTGSDRGNVCYLGFPLYYLQTPQAQAAFEQLLEIFGE